MGTKAIPIYIPAKRPRIGTIGKNHIQSSSNLSGTALFVVCSESDTFLKNYIINLNYTFQPLTLPAIPFDTQPLHPPIVLACCSAAALPSAHVIMELPV